MLSMDSNSHHRANHQAQSSTSGFLGQTTASPAPCTTECHAPFSTNASVVSTDCASSSVRYVSPASSASGSLLMPLNGSCHDRLSLSMVSEHSTKRGRDDCSDSEEDNNHKSAGLPKKTREHNYIVPRSIPETFTSAMGSLAARSVFGCNTDTGGGSNMRVHIRRQLSGSGLDPFLGGGDDSMEVDTEASRPRSMSL